MTDEKEQPKETEETTADPADEKKFSQRDLDELISKRLKEQEARHARDADKKAKQDEEAKRIAALEGEERLKAEWSAKLKAKEEELNEANRNLALSRTEAKLSSAGLPSELASSVIGKDDDETDANIARLSKLINDQVAAKVSEGLNHGTPPAQAGVNAEQARKEHLRAAMRS